MFILAILKSVVGNFPGNWEIKLLITRVSVKIQSLNRQTGAAFSAFKGAEVQEGFALISIHLSLNQRAVIHHCADKTESDLDFSGQYSSCALERRTHSILPFAHLPLSCGSNLVYPLAN